MTKKPYFENLDGLRFLCFLSVFLYHSFYTSHKYILDSEIYKIIKLRLFSNGNIGVNFFFVLSGFLITYLLIIEKKKTGTINIRRFWMRRILRIWPLFYLCVGVGFLVFPFVKQLVGQVPQETANYWTYLTFTNNFDFINKGLPDASILGVLWSIAVEEQFYFVWPIVLYLIPLHKWYIAFISVIVISWIFRAQSSSWFEYEHHTLSCIGDMAVGSLGSWLIIEHKNFRKWIVQTPKFVISVLYIAFAVLFLFRYDFIRTFPTLEVFERTGVGLLILAIILEQNYAQNSLFKLSRFKAISKLGLITYGMYCLHFVGILIATALTRMLGLNSQLWQVLFLDTSLALIITVVLGKISFFFYEKPFLKLKKRFET